MESADSWGHTAVNPGQAWFAVPLQLVLMRVVEKFQPGLAVGLGLPGGVLARGGFVVGDLAFSAVLARQRTAGVLVQPGLAIDAQPPP